MYNSCITTRWSKTIVNKQFWSGGWIITLVITEQFQNSYCLFAYFLVNICIISYQLVILLNYTLFLPESLKILHVKMLDKRWLERIFLHDMARNERIIFNNSVYTDNMLCYSYLQTRTTPHPHTHTHKAWHITTAIKHFFHVISNPTDKGNTCALYILMFHFLPEKFSSGTKTPKQNLNWNILVRLLIILRFIKHKKLDKL